MGKRTSPSDVFINCPFDDDYSKIFQAILFTLYACGFRPRTTLEVDDGSESRLEKLVTIIRECRYGIHDISRTELDRINRLPRFNMPLELGIFLGAKRFGGAIQKEKRALVLDAQQYRYQKFISDLAGMDIHAHGNNPKKAMAETRDWLTNVSRRQLPSSKNLNAMYTKFRSKLQAITKKAGLDHKRISYADYERIVANWLLEI